MQEVPLNLYAFGPGEFLIAARDLLEHALRYPDENSLVTLELFPEELQGLARRVKATIASVGP